MMWKKPLAITILAVLVIGFWSGPVLAQGKGRGGGGGGGTSATQALYLFAAPPQLYQLVTGDDQPSATFYETEGTEGVEAIIMGSGNPALSMEGDITQNQRTIFVQLDSSEPGCGAPLSFDGIQGNGTVGVGAGIRLWFNGLWEQVYEGNPGGGWLDLPEGESKFGHLVVRFQTVETGLGVVTWYLNFGGNYNGNSPGSERVVVQRETDSLEGYPIWRVTGVDGLLLSKAKVTKSYEVPMNGKKTATVTEDLGLCKAHIDFEITQLAVPGN